MNIIGKYSVFYAPSTFAKSFLTGCPTGASCSVTSAS